MKKKKAFKSSNQLFFSTVPITFLKTEKVQYSDIWVKIDIAIMLSLQTQIVWLQIARASH